MISFSNRFVESYPDKLNYSCLVDRGVLMLKDGAFLTGWNYQGPDLDSASDRELNVLTQQLNATFLELGDEWMLHHNIIRLPAASYFSDGAFPDPVSKLIDNERRRKYQTEKDLYENISSLILTYKPPTAVENMASKIFIEGYQESSSQFGRIKANFSNKIATIEAQMSSVLQLHRMDSEELITTLHTCATGLDHPVHVPDPPIDIDYIIGSQDFVTGFYPKIGNRHVCVVGVTTLPTKSFPEMLSGITQVPMSLRICNRFIFCDPHTSYKLIDRRRAFWEQKKLRPSDMFARSMKLEESGHMDRDADVMMNDALEAEAEASAGHVRYGHYTLNIVLTGECKEETQANAAEVVKLMQHRGVTARVETFTAPEAFLGSLPGHGYYNVRKPLINTANLTHLGCFSTIWAGAEVHPSPLFPPDSPPLMYCSSSGHTPFRFNNFVSDVGSTLVVGPTGSGKTVLLNLIAAQFYRYNNAQVFYFDKRFGAYALTQACGGNHYDLLGRDEGGIGFCPLSMVNKEHERIWAQAWIEKLFELQEMRITPEQRQLITDALVRLGDSKSKTLTELLIQDKELTAALKYYQLGGGSGGILDSAKDSLKWGRFETFEIEKLMNIGEKLTVPVLKYLFHRIEQRFDGRPTLVIIDEAWVMLMNSLSAEQLEEWLRTIRKNNGALILATQGLLEISNSKLRDLLLDSCPCKIFLPNPEATNPINRKQYEAIGLTERKIELISMAIPKRDYYYVSPYGQRMFQLSLGELALSFIGINGATHRQHIDQLRSQWGAEWWKEWLRERSLLNPVENNKVQQDEKLYQAEATNGSFHNSNSDIHADWSNFLS